MNRTSLFLVGANYTDKRFISRYDDDNDDEDDRRTGTARWKLPFISPSLLRKILQNEKKKKKKGEREKKNEIKIISVSEIGNIKDLLCWRFNFHGHLSHTQQGSKLYNVLITVHL